jgi:predicted DNA-binding protein YlxM (UPF0122 family)
VFFLRKDLKFCELVETYGKLFTARQQEILYSYYLDDLSLTEIGDNLGINRQTVKTVIRRAEKKLTEYNENLKIVDKYKRIIQVAEKSGKPEIVEEIVNITKE